MTVAGFKALVAVGFGVRLNKKQAAEVAASIAGLESESSSLRRQLEEAKAEIESLRHAATDEGLAAREMVRAAERERDEARAVLRDVEWEGERRRAGDYMPREESCPRCYSPRSAGHTNACRLASALASARSSQEREGA